MSRPALSRAAGRCTVRRHHRSHSLDYLGRVLTRIEGFGTPKARTTRYEYTHPTWRSFITRIDERSAAKPGASKITTFTWNANETC